MPEIGSTRVNDEGIIMAVDAGHPLVERNYLRVRECGKGPVWFITYTANDSWWVQFFG